MARITVETCHCRNCQARALMGRAGPPHFIDLDYFWTGYSNQAEVDRLRQASRSQAPGSIRVLMGTLREAVSLAAKSYDRKRPHVSPAGKGGIP